MEMHPENKVTGSGIEKGKGVGKGEGKQTVYFGYGSNLSLTQMKERCPGSEWVGVGRLRGWRWGVSGRGFANIVMDDAEDVVVEGGGGNKGDVESREGVVYGLLYSLSPDGEDEERLDECEGVPWAYERFWMGVDVVSGGEALLELDLRGWRGEGESGEGRKGGMEVLVYVDPRGIKEGGKVGIEYMARMNRGIKEAVGRGLSPGYVEEVLRAWIPG